MADAPVQVSAEALTLVYAQIEMLRLIVAGVPRAEASEAGWRLFGELASYLGATVKPPGRAVSAPTRCLAESSAAVAKALALAWPDEFRSRYGRAGPGAAIDAKALARARWLMGAVRRLADGVPALDAATQAKVAAEGKPRKKRKPVTRGYLAGEIDAALAAIWPALHDGALWQASATRPLAAREEVRPK